MKQLVIAFLGGLVAAWTIVMVSSASTDPQSGAVAEESTAEERILTGCLIQGSGPAVFLLEDARTSVEDKTEPGKTYVLVAAPESLRADLRADLNHEVVVTGATGTDTESQGSLRRGGQLDERTLPTLVVRTLTTIADRCPAPI